MPDSKNLPTGYKHWMRRFERILAAYRHGLISEADLQKFQLFLLDSGQFNATFTLEELKRLKYPRSPFVRMDTHTYIRAADTWAMKVLRSKYQECYYNVKLFPIWIDSPLFWDELERYCRVREYSTEDSILDSYILAYENDFYNEKEQKIPLWIKQEKSQINSIDNLNERIKKKASEEVLRIVLEKSGNLELFPLFFDILLGRSIRIFNLNRFNFPLLDKLFPEVKKELKERVRISSYLESIKQWLEKFIKTRSKKFCENIIYYYPDKIFGIDAIVLCSNKNKNFIEFMNSIGYRIDPIRAIRKVLEIFPGLFFDHDQTQIFLGYFLETEMIRELSEEENQKIKRLFNKVLSRIKSYSTDQDKNFGDRLDIFDNELILLSKLLGKLRSNSNKGYFTSPGFEIYADYLFFYLSHYQKTLIFNHRFRFISDPEIKEVLEVFLNPFKELASSSLIELENLDNLSLETLKNLDLSSAVRATQIISEILILGLSLQPTAPNLSNIIAGIIKTPFLNGVLITPYAMRSFTQVFQLLDDVYKSKKMTMSITNQSYYEWLHNMEQLDPIRYSVSRIQHLSYIDPNCDVIFLELHPNNVVETKQFSHDVYQLLLNMSQWKQKQRTLVIDATLNALNDSEIQNILIQANDLILKGHLNLILIQSLTKFSQLGLDKRSGGLSIVLNHGEYWNRVNEKINYLNQNEITDFSTAHFFSYFFINFYQHIQAYINHINRHVRMVYEKTILKLNELEVLDSSCFQLTVSSDPKACYIALNMRGLIPKIDKGFTLVPDDIEKFSEDLLQYLILPLFALFNLPVTERQSIGFPLTSVNSMFDSLRFTIGLESENQLNCYPEILAYVSFVLNNRSRPECFFEVDNPLESDRKKRNYSLRREYFEEKYYQFKAMTPQFSFSYKIQFENYDQYGIVFDKEINQDRRLKRGILYRNGEMNFFYEDTDQSSGKIEWHQVSPKKIISPIRIRGEVRLSDRSLLIDTKRYIAACFTGLPSESRQDVNFTIDHSSKQVFLESYEVIGPWNSRSVYGPYWHVYGENPDDRHSVFFSLHQKMISIYYRYEEPSFIGNLKLNGGSFLECIKDIFSHMDEDYFAIMKNILYGLPVFFKQGNIYTPANTLMLEEQAFIIREGCYFLDRSASTFPRLHKISNPVDMQYVPTNKSGSMKISIEGIKNPKNGNTEVCFVIEHDFFCYGISGATICKRYIEEKNTCYEVDLWGEKNPVLARFMRLMVAVFVKEQSQANFIAANCLFIHFFFTLTYEEGDSFFKPAVDRVMNKKFELERLMEKHVVTTTTYFFSKLNNAPRRPSGYSSIDYIQDAELIQNALAILRN